MRKSWKRGYTLVEVIVSMSLLMMAAFGFMVVFTGNARILSRQYRYGRHSQALFKIVESQTGDTTGLSDNLIFECGELGLAGELTLRQYQAQSSKLRLTENYRMYYYDYQ